MLFVQVTNPVAAPLSPSDTERVHLYQIWLLPQRTGLEPSYEHLYQIWLVDDRNPDLSATWIRIRSRGLPRQLLRGTPIYPHSNWRRDLNHV